jgi:hypothetical protein
MTVIREHSTQSHRSSAKTIMISTHSELPGVDMRLISLLFLVHLGCAADEGIQYGVATNLLISRVDENQISEGFNLDGIDSTEDGSTGCGIGDYTNALGESGVDNAMARLVPVLEQTEAIAAEDLIHQAINSGELIILFEMTEVGSDPLHDEAVTLNVLRGEGKPIVGTDGRLVAGQTFDIDTAVVPTGEPEVTLDDGLVTASGLTLNIPLEIFDARLNAVLENASVRIAWNDDGTFSGYMGGGLDYWAIVDMAINSNVDQALAESLPLLFASNADLDPSDMGTCQKISFTFVFDGVPAYVFGQTSY